MFTKSPFSSSDRDTEKFIFTPFRENKIYKYIMRQMKWVPIKSFKML